MVVVLIVVVVVVVVVLIVVVVVVVVVVIVLLVVVLSSSSTHSTCSSSSSTHSTRGSSRCMWFPPPVFTVTDKAFSWISGGLRLIGISIHLMVGCDPVRSGSVNTGPGLQKPR